MANRATAMQLSATELRQLTKWPDPVIVEFLSLQGNANESGSVIIPAAATSLIVTASVNATSIIMATVAQDDTTLKSVVVVAANGEFELIPNAAPTADCRVDYLILT
jgi:hypothetical protein